MVFMLQNLIDVLVKSQRYVIPADGACPGMIEAGGIYNYLKTVDSAIKSRNDKR